MVERYRIFAFTTFYRADSVPRAVDSARPKVGHQQVPSAEHVQRQVAVVPVVPVEEALLLPTVQAPVRSPARSGRVKRH